MKVIYLFIDYVSKDSGSYEQHGICVASEERMNHIQIPANEFEDILKEWSKENFITHHTKETLNTFRTRIMYHLKEVL